jgi:hypothetical protein
MGASAMGAPLLRAGRTLSVMRIFFGRFPESGLALPDLRSDSP